MLIAEQELADSALLVSFERLCLIHLPDRVTTPNTVAKLSLRRLSRQATWLLP